MKNIYETDEWNNYAEAHLTVLTSAQLEIYNSVSEYASGNVADFGCGTARISPFLIDNTNVISYTGIDYSNDMVRKARWLISHLQHENRYKILNKKIEDVSHSLFDFGCSIHSYYSWPEPMKVLKHIHNLLLPESSFILVTPNKQLDMVGLLKSSDKELISHPHYQAFKKQNLALAGNEHAIFTDMHTLVEQAINVGFKILDCHQHFYNGGVNYLHLQA